MMVALVVNIDFAIMMVVIVPNIDLRLLLSVQIGEKLSQIMQLFSSFQNEFRLRSSLVLGAQM